MKIEKLDEKNYNRKVEFSTIVPDPSMVALVRKINEIIDCLNEKRNNK